MGRPEADEDNPQRDPAGETPADSQSADEAELMRTHLEKARRIVALELELAELRRQLAENNLRITEAQLELAETQIEQLKVENERLRRENDELRSRSTGPASSS
jgi:hypothetical protein